MTDIVKRLRDHDRHIRGRLIEGLTDLVIDDMVEAADTIERLREALRMIADGDVPRQHVVRWRQDGQLSKHDKCPHDKWMYDDCDECVASFARAALGEKE